MIAKVKLAWNRRQYTEPELNCEIVEKDREYTTFKRPKTLLENPRQRKYTEFRVANYLLPLYFYTEES
ncbi:hypothetical protein IW492_02770 [Enterococcus sp. BWB1-3]|uniref:hypothetical protein n=1 Tax=Enterococcus sp. BWB1-3 TaxID=2787713 RepID=UPI0019240022|nr:hypothetical protein [Enterococcus sp. BWB1-3]MBL1228154.1 hypothetical protein [Enterococcus sp. BWB1-3]